MVALKNISVGYKLGLLMALSLVGALVISTIVLLDFKHNLLEDRKAKTQNVVQVAVSLVRSFVELEKSGDMTREEAQASAVSAVKRLRYDGENYFWINDMHPNMIMHPFKPELDGTDISGNADPKGTHLFVEMAKVVKASKQGFVPYMWPKPGMDVKEPSQKISYVEGIEEWGWIIGSGIYIDDVDVAFRHEIIKLGIAIGIIFIIMMTIGYLISNDIRKALQLISKGMRSMAEGKRLETDGLHRKDEIGSMGKVLEYLDGKLHEAREMEAAQQKEAIAKQAQQERLEALVKQFDNKVRTIISSVLDAAGQLQKSSEATSSLIGDTQNKASSVALASGSTAQNVQAVAAAAEEMSASVHEIAQQIIRSSQTVESAMQEMHKADEIAHMLDQATMRIGQIVDLIQNIAGQINLLALNATIESARAGEAGKGFAVVAGEVKQLATQTSKATDEISQSIDNVKSVSEQVIVALQSIRTMIANVNDISASISSAVEEQSAVTNEIAVNMSRASEGSRLVSSDIEGVSQASTQVSAAASQTFDAANALTHQAKELGDEITRFLNEVRK